MTDMDPATPWVKGCLGVALNNVSLHWNPTNDTNECLPAAAHAGTGLSFLSNHPNSRPGLGGAQPDQNPARVPRQRGT